MDSNGDGCGDFEGLSRRLDHLESLGVDALWLAPFQPSPRRDDGYDITDYFGVDSRFGTSGDFVEFVHQAGSRGMRVMIDLVVNHTSDRHAWFRRARDRASPLHDWYVWSKKRPSNWRSGVVFPGDQQSTWTFDREAGEYFFHRFYDFQPDLNMDNPRVREEVRRVMGFWLQLGVAGFRVDAVPFLIEKPPRGRGRRRLHFEYLQEFRDFLQWRVGDAVLLGEANVPPAGVAAVLRGRRRAAHDVQLLGEPASLPLARVGRRPAARGRAPRHEEAAPDCAMGQLPAKPRRARPRAARRRRPRARVRRVREGRVDASVRPRHPAAAGADARRPPPARARVQPRPLLPGNAGAALRRRDRHGREPPAAGALGDPHADAVVGRSETAASRLPSTSSGRSSTAARTASRRSTSSRSGATPIRCCAGRRA